MRSRRPRRPALGTDVDPNGRGEEERAKSIPAIEPTLRALIEARYRADAVAAIETCNPTLETVLSDRSVRAYRRDQLPPQTLELLVAAAQSASTSSNLQTWSLVAVEDNQRKSRLAALADGQNHIV